MIKLLPMSGEDYQVFLAKIIPEYAADKVQAGNWNETEALERSRQEIETYLPHGLQTPGHFLYKLVNENDEAVGLIWYAIQQDRPQEAFIYDFEIQAPFRRRGYASQALAALEVKASQQGFSRIALHVFGFNNAARELYKKSGFIEKNIHMVKEIPDTPGNFPV